MNIEGKWLAIQSYKHDGSIHRWWDRGMVLENSDDYIVIATKKAKVTESNGRRWYTKEPAVTIFSKHEFWNVICMFKKDGICYYCNIASPTIIDKTYIKYIDYDLDAKLFPDGSIRVLDEKEYDHHKKSFGYGEELDTVLHYQINEVIRMMKERVFPFVDSKIKEYFDTFLSKMNNND